jgi:mRNA-degrading endonuclease RelE of RelBE toxin-antitoxin system
MTKKAEKDLSEAPSAVKARILRAIRQRLAVAPLSFGKQLRHDLAWCRSLGVGNWRIGYTVEGETVFIEHIEPRRDAYKNW